MQNSPLFISIVSLVILFYCSYFDFWQHLISSLLSIILNLLSSTLQRGAFGTSASLTLRLGQTVFSSASLCFMCFDVGFYSYTSFSCGRITVTHCDFYKLQAVASIKLRFLVTVMGLSIPWSITLFLVDAYSVCIHCMPIQKKLIQIIVLGDMVMSYLSLAAACSAASVTDILHQAGESHCPAKSCGRYQLSAAMAFLSWFLSSASCLFNFWLLPSL